MFVICFRYVEKTPVPTTNQVNEAMVMAAMPTANLTACRSDSENALLQVAQ
jgi:hypothetical protein